MKLLPEPGGQIRHLLVAERPVDETVFQVAAIHVPAGGLEARHLHPMGGGEGRSSGGRHPCSPWGQKSKGARTRNNKRTDKMIVRRRGKKG